MATTPRIGDLEIQQDIEFQRREWKWQRVGWVVMAVLLLAALLGVVGSGPLSSARVSSPDGALSMAYNRFIHYHNGETLRIDIAPRTAEKGEVHLWLDRAYLDGIEIQKITPDPVRVEAGADRHTYVFRITDPEAPTSVSFHYEADCRGMLPGRVGLAGGDGVPFQQFVYP